jgi:bifunctional non-homologous end joining protein LigD
VKILGAMQTPDGEWRVEIVQTPRSRRAPRDQGVSYRLVHAENVVEGLSIATVGRLLAEAGVDMSDLVEVQPEPEADTQARRAG